MIKEVRMPGGDRTGPAGMGPMSGRAGGYCAGYSAPGFNNPGSGRFMGAGRGSFGGRGRGAGYRNWYRATGRPGWSRYDTEMPARGGTAGVPYYRDNYPLQDMDPGEEAEMLKQQTDYLKQQINDIKDRIKELSKDQQSS
jgi:hypothetical protein